MLFFGFGFRCESLARANSDSIMTLMLFCSCCWWGLSCRLGTGAWTFMGWYWNCSSGKGTGPCIAGAEGDVERGKIGWLEAPRHPIFFLLMKQKMNKPTRMARVAVPERARCKEWIH